MSEPKSNVSTYMSKAMPQDKVIQMLTDQVVKSTAKEDTEFHVAYFIDGNTLSGVNVSAPDVAQAASKACAEHNVPLHLIAYIAQHGIRISIAE